MKKTVALTLCLLILMFSSFSTSTFAAIIETKQLTIEEKELVKEKKALREWCISNNIAKKFSPDTRAERVAARRKILNEMLSGEMEQTIGLEKLEELGVYVLESSLLSNNQILPLASPTVLSFNNVIVLYNSEE